MLICIHRLRRLVNAGLFTHIFHINWCRISAIDGCLAADGKRSVKTNRRKRRKTNLVGGFKYLLFSSLPGEMIQFD